MSNMKDQNIIISNWINNGEEPLLSIVCTTFNHEDFIGETLKGFLIQETNFPFEIIVHDDASTDKTALIVKEFADKYPLLIKSIFQKENQYSRNDINIWSDITFPQAKGKYMALCEGDDYWIDPLKLQKQVDFLENNADYAITWTDFLMKKESEMVPNDFKDSLQDIYTIDFDNLFVPYCTYTLTAVFRKTAVDPLDYKKFAYGKDNTLYALALCNGKGAYMNFQSAVYRWHCGGIYSLQKPFTQRYSSYLNVKEIYEHIPQSQTANIKNVMKTLLKASAYEALKSVHDKTLDNTKQKDAIKEFLKQASIGTRIKFFIRSLKSKMSK
jgi:glycosyltransferase involved in cell wall biosynthesis